MIIFIKNSKSKTLIPLKLLADFNVLLGNLQLVSLSRKLFFFIRKVICYKILKLF